jgi:hypothetical protein
MCVLFSLNFFDIGESAPTTFMLMPIVMLSLFVLIGVAMILSSLISTIRYYSIKTVGSKINGTFEEYTSSNNALIGIIVSFNNEEGDKIIAKGYLNRQYVNTFNPGDSFPLIVKGNSAAIDYQGLKEKDLSRFNTSFSSSRPTSSSTFDSSSFGDRIKYCPKCGMQLHFGDKFCSNCGNKIDE